MLKKGEYSVKKIIKVTSVLLLAVAALAIVLELGCLVRVNTFEPWTPEYEKIDISYLLDGRALSDEEYELLFRQTGLTSSGIDDLISEGEQWRIVKIQDSFFDDGGYSYYRFGWLMSSFDKDAGHYAYPVLRDGDIVCCFSTFMSSFEIGHCAIVVDGELRLLAETADYSATFDIIGANEFFKPAAFAVLRPMTDDATKAEAVRIAMDELYGTGYSIFAGILEPKARTPINKTHCSHSVWYAYERAGLDLDSNGGKIVTPRDIFESPHLELICVRGIDISTLNLVK